MENGKIDFSNVSRSNGSVLQLELNDEKKLVSLGLIGKPLTMSDLKQVKAYNDITGKITRNAYRKQISTLIGNEVLTLKQIRERFNVVTCFGNLKSLDCLGAYSQKESNGKISDKYFIIFLPKESGKVKAEPKAKKKENEVKENEPVIE
jgi:hypothetical protein